MKSIKTALFGIFAAFILSACGGGGGGPAPVIIPPIDPSPPVNIPCILDCPSDEEAPDDNSETTDETPPSEEDETSIMIQLNPSNELNFRTAEFTVQYGLGRINADAAYSRDYFGQSVTVAVVDTGMLTSHVDLRDNVVAGYDVLADTAAINEGISDYWNSIGHGSFVGGIVAASKNDSGMHGVAPSAKLMPLQFGHGQTGELRGEPIDAFNFALDRNVQIINNSWGASTPLFGQYSDGRHYQVWLPYLPQFWNSQDREYMKQIADTVGNSDTIFVWAAGNAGWRDTNEKTILLCDDLRDGLTFRCSASDRLFVSPNELLQNFESVAFNATSVTIRYNVLGDRNNYITLREYESPAYGYINAGTSFPGDNRNSSPGYYGLIPEEHPQLENRWLVVVATDENNQIASFSNGCGDAANWCLAAPGVSIYSVSGAPRTFFGTPTPYRTSNGTSFAAPHVSGALALLKSAAPELRMTVIRNILLTTATDLGDSGVDAVYGWGLVNVSAGIATLNGMQIPATAGRNAVAVRDLRNGLPSELSHLRGRMAEVSVAVQITDDYYENVALSDIVGGGDSHSASLGNAAKEMQADDFTAGESFRFWGGLEYDGSRSSYIGEGGGIFSAANASDTGGYVKWTTADYAGLSAFGEYGRTQIKADYDSASFISQIQNARAEEWTAGFQYRDLFLHNDNLQFSARQESRISGGEMVLHYPIADGDSHKAFIGESVQTIRTETARIPIKQKPQTIYTAGYSQKTENSKWSAAAEWNSATNAKGVSFAIEFALH